jgi:hypothetical protein
MRGYYKYYKNIINNKHEHEKEYTSQQVGCVDDIIAHHSPIDKHGQS